MDRPITRRGAIAAVFAGLLASEFGSRARSHRRARQSLQGQARSLRALHFAPVSAEAQAKINSGPIIGSCGGCEYRYGQQQGV